MADHNSNETLASPSRRKALTRMGLAAGSGMVWSLPHIASAAATPLKCAGAYTDTLFHTRNLTQFAREANGLSQGGLQIEVVTNAKLMPMNQVMPALSKGDLAIGEIFMARPMIQ